MTDSPDMSTRIARTNAMKKLPQELRESLIAKSDNVIGYGRFIDRQKQVSLRYSYRKPIKPNPGGVA